jgi:hypothetical protein
MASFALTPDMKEHAEHIMRNPHEKVMHPADRKQMIHILKHVRDLNVALAGAYFDNEWLFENLKELKLENLGLSQKQAKAYKTYLKDLHKAIEKAVSLHTSEFQQVESLWVKHEKPIAALKLEE